MRHRRVVESFESQAGLDGWRHRHTVRKDDRQRDIAGTRFADTIDTGPSGCLGVILAAIVSIVIGGFIVFALVNWWSLLH